MARLIEVRGELRMKVRLLRRVLVRLVRCMRGECWKEWHRCEEGEWFVRRRGEESNAFVGGIELTLASS